MHDHAAATDIGRVRDHNEDAYTVVPLIDGVLCAVADGMGGHAAGEVASELAVESMNVAGRLVRRGETALPLLEQAVDEAHAKIREQAQDGRQGMGCTLTAGAVRPGQVELLHIGDSRAYRLRGDEIEQLTKDDSLVGEMVRQNLISREEAQRHPSRSVLLRALGVGEVADFTSTTVEVQAKDVLLFCSDGLTTHLTDSRIRELVQGQRSLKKAAQALIEAANEAGGVDNITVVLVRCGGPA